ncbi:uncharacterized protein LOC134690908 [Mytilus trossulus]|uniref:uncharacterized protein LOC134690908 n=1 Tax=Mytilus trossulus TaxID=6551 RepID=UPI0030077FEE
MVESMEISKRKISPYPTLPEIDHTRNVFVTRFVARFVQKHRKYAKLLQENGASLPEAFSNCSVNFCATFEDEVDMIVSEKRNKINNACRMKGAYSIKGLFRQIYQIVRRARASRIESKLLDIPNHDILETLRDIASELGFAYEYQIAMLKTEAEVRLLADHAVSCTMNFLKQSDATLNRCHILEAVTDVSPKKSLSRAEKVQTRIQKTNNVKVTKTQKWRLSEILKQPGLRIPDTDGIGYNFLGCFTPYGSLCRPDKYGFRGPLHVWDENTSGYALLYNDKVSCNSVHRREIERDITDIHQNYQPIQLCSHVCLSNKMTKEGIECKLDSTSIHVANKKNTTDTSDCCPVYDTTCVDIKDITLNQDREYIPSEQPSMINCHCSTDNINNGLLTETTNAVGSIDNTVDNVITERNGNTSTSKLLYSGIDNNEVISSKDGSSNDSGIFVESNHSSHQRLTGTNSDVENSNTLNNNDGQKSPLKTKCSDDILVAT